MAGRRAEPIDILRAKGRKHLTKEEIEKRAAAEAKLKPGTDRVKPPTWLSKEAKKVWRQTAEELKRLDLLTNISVTTFAVYCDAVWRYTQASTALGDALTVEHTNKFGAVNEVPNPHVAIAKTYASIIRQFASDFGLNPSALIKLSLPKGGDKPKDRFEEMFGS